MYKVFIRENDAASQMALEILKSRGKSFVVESAPANFPVPFVFVLDNFGKEVAIGGVQQLNEHFHSNTMSVLHD